MASNLGESHVMSAQRALPRNNSWRVTRKFINASSNALSSAGVPAHCGKSRKQQFPGFVDLSERDNYRKGKHNLEPFWIPYDKCTKIFPTRKNLDRHKDTHQERSVHQRHECDGCGNEYTIQNSLNEPLKAHGDREILFCTHHNCGKKFFTRGGLDITSRSIKRIDDCPVLRSLRTALRATCRALTFLLSYILSTFTMLWILFIVILDVILWSTHWTNTERIYKQSMTRQRGNTRYNSVSIAPKFFQPFNYQANPRRLALRQRDFTNSNHLATTDDFSYSNAPARTDKERLGGG